MEPTDPTRELVTRAQGGDRDAFAELVVRHAHEIQRFLRAMCRNVEDAEDLTQKTFLNALRGIWRYDPAKASFRTWLYKIARNVAFDRKRERRRRPEAQSVEGDAEASPGAAPPSRERNQLEHVISEESKALLRQALDGLTGDERAAVCLHYFENLSYKQVAEVLERSDVAVKSLLKRARAKLRDELARLGMELPNPESAGDDDGSGADDPPRPPRQEPP